MIKTIIFDNQGVLVTNQGVRVFHRMTDLLNVSEEKLGPIYDRDLTALDQGKMSGETFYKNMIDGLGIKADPRQLMEIVKNTYTQKAEVIDILLELKKDFEVALLTNFGDYFEECEEKWQITKLFEPDKVFVSCKIGMSKPNVDIYIYALEKLGREPSEVIFIDDNAENVEAASSLGIFGVQFTSPEKLKLDLESVIDRKREEANV